MTVQARNGSLVAEGGAAQKGATSPEAAPSTQAGTAGGGAVALRGAPAITVRLPRGPMRGVEQVSALIGDIYDAAIAPAQWPEVLAQIASFVGGTAAALFCKDAATKRGNVYYDCGGTDPRYKQLYFEDYIKIDPSSTGHCFADIGKPVTIPEILDYDEFIQTRFYQEWVRPQQLVDNISVVLDKSATGAALFAVFRHERDGPADKEACRRMSLIAPHVRRAALVGRTLEHGGAEAATLADTLDGLSAAMLLVDATGRIVHANAAGRVMLAQGSVLRAPGGKLATVDTDAGRSVQDLIAAAGGGDTIVAERGIALPLKARDGERYVMHALPLTSAERRRVGTGYAAVVALFVQKASLVTPAVPEVIAKAFNLTPTELRVLLAVVEMGGVPETADALGVGQATVKTHLHRLFSKTASRRQSDLVKLVAGFASPLAG